MKWNLNEQRIDDDFAITASTKCHKEYYLTRLEIVIVPNERPNETKRKNNKKNNNIFVNFIFLVHFPRLGSNNFNEFNRWLGHSDNRIAQIVSLPARCMKCITFWPRLETQSKREKKNCNVNDYRSVVCTHWTFFPVWRRTKSTIKADSFAFAHRKKKHKVQFDQMQIRFIDHIRTVDVGYARTRLCVSVRLHTNIIVPLPVLQHKFPHSRATLASFILLDSPQQITMQNYQHKYQRSGTSTHEWQSESSEATRKHQKLRLSSFCQWARLMSQPPITDRKTCVFYSVRKILYIFLSSFRLFVRRGRRKRSTKKNTRICK